LEYRWNFGDDDDARWAYGANPGVNRKNRATGANTAHLYETPGTYTTTLSVTDGTNTASKTYVVTVTDPEVVYAGKTTCVSSSGDFTGAPTGATQVTSSDFSNALKNALAAGARRVLFRRGDSFSAATLYILTADGPVTIGAFGSGARPVISCANDNTSAIASWTAHDWRVMDLEINGNGTRAAGVSLTGDAYNNTVLRVHVHDSGTCVGPGGHYAAVVDCDLLRIPVGQGIMPIYAQDVFGLFVAGCHMDSNGGGEYVMRYQGGTHGTISNNTFGRCGDKKATFTLRGDSSQTTYIAQYHQISDNLFDASTSVGIAFIVTVNPQNSGRNEKIQDVIIERNIVIANPGGMDMISFCASDVTVRNNLLDATNIGSGPAISISYGNNTAGLPAPARNHIYNNTIFSNGANNISGVILYNAGMAVLDTVVKNNFLYAPNSLHDGGTNGHSANFMYDWGTNTLASNNTLDSQTKNISPTLSVLPPTAPADWKLATGCYGLGTGTSVPVWSDFFQEPLTASSPRNLGAVAK
jgi:hypothetical protein